MISVTGAPGAQRLDAAVAAVSTQVTPANVLAVRDTILDKAADLEAGLKLHWKAATTMPQLAGDPVSADAAVAFPEKTQALLAYCRTYVSDLRDAAHALDATARAYGLTEDEIAGTMHAVAADPPTDPAAGPGGGAIDRILNPHLYGG